jgi:hypothetical protein
MLLSMENSWHKWQAIPNTSPTKWSYHGSGYSIEMNDTNASYTYTQSVPWGTTSSRMGTDRDGKNSQLLGHNGAHTLKVVGVEENGNVLNTSSLRWQKRNWNSYDPIDMSRSLPSTFNVNVQNLVVTNVSGNAGNSDYIKFNPAGDDNLKHPKIKFSFKNDADPQSFPNRYQWWLWIRKTTVNQPSSFSTYEGYIDAPGEKTITVNSTDGTYTKDSDIGDWGTYAFDIHIKDTKTGDWQGIRSQKVSIPNHSLDYVQDPGANLNAEISYILDGEKDAARVQVDLIDSKLVPVAAYVGTPANGGLPSSLPTPRSNFTHSQTAKQEAFVLRHSPHRTITLIAIVTIRAAIV